MQQTNIVKKQTGKGRHTDKQTDRQIDREAGGADRLAGRQEGRHAGRHAGRHTRKFQTSRHARIQILVIHMYKLLKNSKDWHYSVNLSKYFIFQGKAQFKCQPENLKAVSHPHIGK